MKKRSVRGTITRESVVDAALAIADREGFERVTIRAISEEIGATPMALYTYFSSKAALYEGMRERISGYVGEKQLARRPWRSMLDKAARDLRRMMREHPGWTPLFAAGQGSRSTLGFVDALVDAMQKEGFAIEEAILAYGSVMSFAVGSVLFERMLFGTGGSEGRRLAFLKRLVEHAPDRYGSYAAAAAKSGHAGTDDTFEFALQSLLASIETRRRPRRPRAPRAQT